MPWLPPGREKAARRGTKHLPEVLLSTLEETSRCLRIEAVHFVAAIGQHGGRSPTSLTVMKISVKQQLVGSVLQEPAVSRVIRHWPDAMPVRYDAEGQAPPNQGREVPDHLLSLVLESRSSVVDTDEEGA
jgi:hypothetical protein